jgi:DNA-directed RNA polymerase subunit beta
VTAFNAGTVHFVDASTIVVKREEAKKSASDFLDVPEYDTYNLRKFERSNQDSCINQRPIVSVGQKVLRGDILGDGPSTEQGELALGKNITVAFLPSKSMSSKSATPSAAPKN